MMGIECITASLGDDSEPSIPPGFGPFAALALQGIQKDARPADAHPSAVQVLQSVQKHVESFEFQPHSAQSRNDTHCSTSESETCRQSLRNRPPIDYSRFDNISDEDSDVEVAEKAVSSAKRRQKLPKGVIRGCAGCSDCQKVHIRLLNSCVSYFHEAVPLLSYVFSHHAGYCKLESSWCTEACS